MRAMLKTASARPRRGRFSLASVVFLVLLVGLGRPAKGDDKATAKAHYETATRLYDIREYDKALLEYKAGYLAQPDPAFLFNIGQCYRKLGQSAEALNFFHEYLKKASPDDPNRPQVEARVRDMEAEAKLKLEATQSAPTATPPNQGPSPPPTVPVPAPGSPAEPPSVTSVLPPAAGSVQQAAQVSAVPQPSHPGRGLRIAGIACAATGLASVGFAIYFYTRATTLSDRVTNSQAPTISDDQAGRDAVTMQWVFYSVGAGAIATGALLYWLGWPSAPSDRTAARITPVVGPGLAGISAQGTF